ncbi:hypothetical protein [Micromonospora sp. NPDC004704]
MPVPYHRLRRFAVLAPVTALALVATLAGATLAVQAHTPSPLTRTDAEVVDDALPRLEFLRRSLNDGSAQRMQQLFPEGYLFLHALYGLSWVDVGTRSAAHRDRALTEARRALAEVDSDAGRAPFSPALDPPYGVFHAGWSNWLRGGVVRLAGGPAGAPAEAERLTTDAAALAAAFDRQLGSTGSPFLTAYPGQAWPVDSTVGLAVLRLTDHLAGTDAYTELIRRWRTATDERRDPATGLLPHRVDPTSGQPVEGARATRRPWHCASCARCSRPTRPATGPPSVPGSPRPCPAPPACANTRAASTCPATWTPDHSSSASPPRPASSRSVTRCSSATGVPQPRSPAWPR